MSRVATGGRGRATGSRRPGVAPAAVLAALALLLLAGCGGTQVGTGAQGFVSADGLITTLDPEDRREPVGPVAGTTLEGDPVDLADLRGQVVVMNVWGSWCAPCIREAPALVAAYEQLSDRGVVFLGINVRERSRDSGLAFERSFGVPYPSIYDPAGETLLSFRGTIPANAIPSTLVIDAEGRVAAGKLDEITTSTLVGLVEEVLEDGAAGAAGAAGPGAGGTADG